MGQLALGVRSLLIRLMIFIIMAILLAWALGGTLWPRPVTAAAITASSGEINWTWNARVSSYDMSTPLTYNLKWTHGDQSMSHYQEWTEVAGFVFVADEGWTAAAVDRSHWMILSLHADGSIECAGQVSDRLAANAWLLSKQP
jgi:hypothetical protein